MGSSGSVIDQTPDESRQLIGIILAAVGLIHLFLGVLWFRFVLPEEKLKRLKSKSAAMTLVLGVALVAAAFIESPSLLALVWTFLSKDLGMLLPAVLISMVGLYYSRGQALRSFDYVEKKQWLEGEGQVE